jgi:hypothetical protein
MGTLDLPKERWKDLANAIEEKLNNEAPFSFEPSSPVVEKLAAHYAQMILSKSLNQAAEKATDDGVNKDGQRPPAAANYQHVDINSVQTSESKSIGAEYVMAEQMNQYGFDKILRELDFNPKQIDYAKHLIIGRSVHPSSERELARWINDDSAMKELIGSTEAVYDNALHLTDSKRLNVRIHSFAPFWATASSEMLLSHGLRNLLHRQDATLEPYSREKLFAVAISVPVGLLVGL